MCSQPFEIHVFTACLWKEMGESVLVSCLQLLLAFKSNHPKNCCTWVKHPKVINQNFYICVHPSKFLNSNYCIWVDIEVLNGGLRVLWAGHSIKVMFGMDSTTLKLSMVLFWWFFHIFHLKQKYQNADSSRGQNGPSRLHELELKLKWTHEIYSNSNPFENNIFEFNLLWSPSFFWAVAFKIINCWIKAEAQIRCYWSMTFKVIHVLV